jgi:hypothetical protein
VEPAGKPCQDLATVADLEQFTFTLLCTCTYYVSYVIKKDNVIKIFKSILFYFSAVSSLSGRSYGTSFNSNLHFYHKSFCLVLFLTMSKITYKVAENIGH